MSKKERLEEMRRAHKTYGKDLPRLEKEMKKFIREGYRTGDPLLVGCAYYYLAYNTYRYGGERDTFLSYAITADAMLEETRDHLMIAKCLNLLGIAYLGQENYQMALESYNKAYQVVKRHKRQGVDGMIILNNIADCYYEMSDFKSSIKIFTDCLAATTVHDKNSLENVLIYSINLAECYERDGDFARAREILGALSDRAEKVEVRMWVCIYYALLARVQYALGEREAGQLSADKSYDILDEDSDTYEVHKEFEELALILLREGDIARAEKFVRTLTEYAEKSSHTIDKLIACRAAAAQCRASGDSERAMAYYEELDVLYKRRMSEIKSMQLTVHKKLSEADGELRKLNRRIKASEEKASRDPLTKLLNRTSLLKVAAEFIAAAKKQKTKVGAVFIDIDFFKECNDTYGHSRGDEIIRAVSDACRREESESIRFARYGGDEFFGISHGLTDEEIADIARRICRRLRQAEIPNVRNPNGERVTLSIGLVNVAVTPRSNTIIDIANYADKALYYAKETGKNAIYMFDYGHTDPDGTENYYVKIDF
jgi:diguanylate cyclase (GGDEF)-like protein